MTRCESNFFYEQRRKCHGDLFVGILFPAVLCCDHLIHIFFSSLKLHSLLKLQTCVFRPCNFFPCERSLLCCRRKFLETNGLDEHIYDYHICGTQEFLLEFCRYGFPKKFGVLALLFRVLKWSSCHNHSGLLCQSNSSNELFYQRISRIFSPNQMPSKSNGLDLRTSYFRISFLILILAVSQISIYMQKCSERFYRALLLNRLQNPPFWFRQPKASTIPSFLLLTKIFLRQSFLSWLSIPVRRFALGAYAGYDWLARKPFVTAFGTFKGFK